MAAECDVTVTNHLTLENFTQIGGRGITDPRNGYAQSMAWFRGKLYVGMTRDPLCLMRRPNRTIPPVKMDFWPVKCPDPEVPEFMRGQILSYDPAEKRWEMVYRSPMVTVPEEFQTTGVAYVMRDVGYRDMEVHQGRSDSKPCLYAGSISASGSRILRSEDGVSFEETAGALVGPSIRSLVSFKGKLYTSLVSKLRGHGNESERTEAFESDDPVSGNWRAVSEPGLGDSGNVALFEMAEFNGYLYVATMNPFGGFQLWKTDGEGPAPYHWEKVITVGAYRGFLNEFGISLCEFDGCLYVGTGIAGGGYDRVRKVGPAAAELLRVYPDDTWDLVVGAPRMTPDGFKVPLSGMGPGFDNFLNGYMWRMCVHEGWLYVGTFNASAFVRYRPQALKPLPKEEINFFERLLPTGNFEKFMQHYGGCHLWCTKDGETFYAVIRNGFGTPYNYGVRQMTSSPVGLFVGTANPFGPLVGVKRNGEWRYEPNPRGGAEIWLGSSQTTKQVEGASGYGSRDEQYRHAVLKVGRQIERYLYPILLEDYYEGTGFHHIGYWKDDTTSVRQACEALLDLLVSFISDKQGPTLDVACGKGATTQYLLNYFRSCDLIGVDESQWAVDHCRQKVPAVRFLATNPAKLDFADESFANIICVEGAPYFDTRYKFLKEAVRILEPGGRLVLADILFSKEAVRANRGRYRTNYVKDLESYKRLFQRAGFELDAEVVDLTDNTIPAYVGNISGYMKEKYRAKEISEGKFSAAMSFVSRLVLFSRHYILVAATRR